ncbi:MAG: ribosomal protein L11 methyltransferase [Methanosaeta sp. PtaB.Bin039]|nr:MAG: ribosomal protein L11 methyltransferase [Methanosaeta sp. PtaB.Bin039]OPY46776.1 MAG: ribosomal protein L11 methyltransferase [Methanosaeta sp. PtaU1.Bin028]
MATFVNRPFDPGMKQRQLEIRLQGLEGFSQPSSRLEQYATPPSLAAELLHLAALHGDLGQIADLGCGTGILAIGAALLGARAVGVEIDPLAISHARRNAALAGVEVDIVRGDVSSIWLRDMDAVVMNPPFGAQLASRGDRIFLKKAIQLAPVVYSIHNAGSEGFIRKFVAPARVDRVWRGSLPIKRCFAFHRQECMELEVELYRIVCK